MYHLPMKPASWRDATERQQEHGHQSGKRRPRAPETGKITQLVVLVLSGAQERDDAERADIGDGVGEEIKEDGCFPVAIRRDDTEQQIPCVRDARVGKHPLDVRLNDTDDGADDHRDRGDHRQNRDPLTLQRFERERNTRAKAANAAAFTPVDMKAVTIVGAPSYASGVHMWNGTAEP